MKNLAGQYLSDRHIIRLLGRTAFSEVYLVAGNSPGKQNALKVLRVELSEDEWNAFLPASYTLINLVHPHIIRVEELSIVPLEKNYPALLMEYAPNGTLRRRHPVGSRLPFTAVVSYVSTIADALHYARLHNVIHGDIRPENILLGSDDRILLSDFSFDLLSSIKKIKNSTTAYLAPEQILGKPEPLSDEYSLGVMVYEWLSGELPFSGSQAEIAEQHLSAPPPPLRTKIAAISPDIEEVVLTALAKDPANRFANLPAFARALEQAVQSAVPSPSFDFNGMPAMATGQSAEDTQWVRPLLGSNGAVSSQPAASATQSLFASRISRRALIVGLPLLAVAGGGLLAWRLSGHGASNAISPDSPLLVYLGHSSGVTAVSWSPDGRFIASGGSDHTIQVWNAQTGAHRIILQGLSGQVPAIAWSPDSTRIASAGAGPTISGGPPAGGNTVQVWNAATGTTLYIYHGHTNGITDVAWSPNGKRIASSSTDYTVQLWDATTGANPLIYRTHSWYVWTLAWSPNSQRIASGRPDGTVQIWDAATGKTLLSFHAHLTAVEAVTWSPDGKYIASASDDSTVRVWNSATGALVNTYYGHSGYVLTAVWSPDGRSIASGGSDKTMQVWASLTGKTSYTYTGFSGSVTTLTWSPDSQRIAAGSADGSVQVLQVVK